MLRFLVVLAGLGVLPGGVRAGWADPLFNERSHDFGMIARGPTLDHSFRVTNTTANPLHISGIRIPCACVSATVSRQTLAPGESAIVAARLDSTRATGAVVKMLYIQFDQPEWDEVGLTLQAHIREDIVLTPTTFAAGKAARGTGASATVTVRFPGLVARVVKAKCESTFVTADVQAVTLDTGEAAYQVTARVSKALPVGSWYTTVWLQTDQPHLPLLNVPLTVEVEAALTCTAADFGTVPVGTEVTRRVVVRADQPFKVVAVARGDGQVRVDPLPADRKTVHVLTVHVKATGPGALSRTLQVVTDLTGDNRVDLPVTAIAAP
ncbi:MAG: DUF1573 domain-containing protein [Gemmataceae bacterium]